MGSSSRDPVSNDVVISVLCWACRWDAVGVPLAKVEAVSHVLCDTLDGSGGAEQNARAGS